MKAYSVHWKKETFTKEQDKPERGCTIVVADHIRAALDQFVDEFPDRNDIDSVYTEGEDVLVNGEPV